MPTNPNSAQNKFKISNLTQLSACELSSNSTKFIPIEKFVGSNPQTFYIHPWNLTEKKFYNVDITGLNNNGSTNSAIAIVNNNNQLILKCPGINCIVYVRIKDNVSIRGVSASPADGTGAGDVHNDVQCEIVYVIDRVHEKKENNSNYSNDQDFIISFDAWPKTSRTADFKCVPGALNIYNIQQIMQYKFGYLGRIVPDTNSKRYWCETVEGWQIIPASTEQVPE